MDEDNTPALVLDVLPEDLAEIVHLEVQCRPLGDAVTAGDAPDMEVHGEVRERVFAAERFFDRLCVPVGYGRTEFAVFLRIDRVKVSFPGAESEAVHLQFVEVLPEPDDGGHVAAVHHADLGFGTRLIAGRSGLRLWCKVFLYDLEVF